MKKWGENVKKLTALLLALFLLFSTASSYSAKKNEDAAPTSEPIPEPTLSPDAVAYDPDHPEDLNEDQLY